MKQLEEAHRYIDNAKQILIEKAHKEDNLYKDKKYVRMAGHTAYLGVLIALDDLFGIKKKGRKNIAWYQEELGKVDKKILNNFNMVYETIHLTMAYDGNLSVVIANEGLKEAEKIIHWVETKQEIN